MYPPINIRPRRAWHLAKASLRCRRRSLRRQKEKQILTNSSTENPHGNINETNNNNNNNANPNTNMQGVVSLANGDISSVQTVIRL